MAKEKFLLVSLKESKAKKLAQVISNETCRKILDYLAEKEATESELGKKLSIPISTAHYNLKCLMDGGLVIADEFHYSEKGKEVLHYKLANKYIIIAPKTVYGIKEKLKSILPVTLLVAATAGIIQFVQNKTGSFGIAKLASENIAREVVTESVPSTTSVMHKAIADATMDAVPTVATTATTGAREAAVYEAAPLAQETANQSVEVIRETVTRTLVEKTTPNIALWFLIGAISAIVIYMIVDTIRSRRK
ncbi:helix-turn-helix domain-containing protein [Candidatus Woesearchaeota archaeon]|nr:helix-turn-helix domain-containing protein [Candidatus Woesearchaeota archaeon]